MFVSILPNNSLTSSSMEEKISAPISMEEAKEKIHAAAKHNRRVVEDDLEKGILHLADYSGVRKFKSIRRAIRKGRVSIFGEIYPHRPFKNIRTKRGTPTYMQKRYYEQLTHKNRMCN